MHPSAVHAQALRFSRLETHLHAMVVLSIGRIEDDPRDGCAAPDQFPLVRGPRRLAGTPEVDALEQVGLAGAVGAHDHREIAVELELALGVVAEVVDLEARDPQRGSPTRLGGSA